MNTVILFDCVLTFSLVEIFGGGFVGGDKNYINVGPPDGLLQRSNNSIVYVTMNYRLGAFGWIAGSDFVGDDGVPNAGLHDQRFALEWVQKNIHLFGGDSEQVTVIGESAGGGSILHQITVSFLQFEVMRWLIP